MELKPLHKSAISSAMEKANHYRLLNDPENAESICRDILEHDANDQEAIIGLILALSDQFGGSISQKKEACDFAGQLTDEYLRCYYRGIIQERAGRAMLARTNAAGCKHHAFDMFQEAMENFEQAENLSKDDNDDAILRWNSCLRTIRKRKLVARPEDNYVPYGD